MAAQTADPCPRMRSSVCRRRRCLNSHCPSTCIPAHPVNFGRMCFRVICLVSSSNPVLAASTASAPQTPADSLAAYTERINDFFRVLRTTHGGPSFITDSELDALQAQSCTQEAFQKSIRADSSSSGSRSDAEAAFEARCEWVVRQLSDPYASFLGVERAEELSERYHGRISLGVRLRHVERLEICNKWPTLMRRAIVTAVDARSPAAFAGVRVGDELLQVGEREVGQRPRIDVDDLEGEVGSRLDLLVRPQGKGEPTKLRVRCTALPPATTTVNRLRLSPTHSRGGSPRSFAAPPHAAGPDAAHAAVIRISHFGADTAVEVDAALRDLMGKQDARHTRRRGWWHYGGRSDSCGGYGGGGGGMPRALLFDLRNNEGGLLSTAVATARLFVPRGAHILSLQKASAARGADRSASAPLRTVSSYRRRWYHRGAGGDVRRLPLVLLVNRNTASSAEVFAAALMQSGGAVLVGERTFGKGTSQAFVHLPDGHALVFTVYLLATGRWRHLRPLTAGVEPQVPWSWGRRSNPGVGGLGGLMLLSRNDGEVAAALEAALAWKARVDRSPLGTAY